MFQRFQVAYLRRHVRIKEVRRLGFLRQSVAYVLSQSARNVPHAAAIAQYDITPLVEYAQATKDQIDDDEESEPGEARMQRAVRRGLSAFFLKAFAHGLSHMPELNAFLDYAPWRTGGTLYIAEDINLAFTVHTPMGVVRPIIRNAHKKDLLTVARERRDLTRKARRTDPNELYRKVGKTCMYTAIRYADIGSLPGVFTYIRARLARQKPNLTLKDVPESDKLQVEDVLGSTCTIADIGSVMPGHQTVTVVIPPEIMMFGIGNVHQVPMVVDGEVVPRHAVTIVGTIDHRAIDGGEVFPFHEQLMNYINNPALIYDWKPGDEI